MPSYSVLGSTALVLLTAFLSFSSQQQAQKPDENRFTPVTLIPVGDLDEPMTFEVTRDGKVFISERRTGNIKMYNPTTKTVKVIGTIPVNHTYTASSGQQREAEEGLVGMTLDPNFEQNHWLYAIYASPNAIKHQLSRFEIRADSLILSTEKVILEWDTQREVCCHTGGGMAWDRQGNLYMTIGNNTSNTNGSQTDQRPGRMNWDDQRGAASTNDLRGKILRIHPEPDGTYTIPTGNLFPPGTPNTRPEIYTMGHRNPWRVSVDSRTGFVYWGEVGPDANADSPSTVRGEDELNQARRPGFFGWPYFVGNNRAYPITDYATCVAAPPAPAPAAGAAAGGGGGGGGGGGQQNCRLLPPKDPARPINDSRWNTGLRELPPAQPAFISYNSGISERFPELGSGGRCAEGGPVYHRNDFTNPARPWPAYFEGKWIATDCVRGYIVAITMADNGDFVSMERLFPEYRPVEPMDMKFGPDGDLYVLEYGSTWFAKSPDARLVRIEYNAGNRAPAVEISSNTRGGRVPFNVTLSSAGTVDPDNDQLRYEWRVTPAAGGSARTFNTANPTVPFDRAGEYSVALTVRDAAGATASRSMRIVAGNAPPVIAVDIPSGNRSFFTPGQAIQYAVQVTDPEDGAVTGQNVALSIDYVPEGFDPNRIALGDRPVDATTRFGVAQAVMANSDCRACHTVSPPRSIGPSFTEIAARYQGDAAAATRLATKIRAGGSGVWGEVAMPAHPAITVGEASAIARYIMASSTNVINAMPLAGTFNPEIPEGDNGRGSLIIHAAYTDRGAGSLPAQTAEQILVMRSPQISAGSADMVSNIMRPSARGAGATAVMPRANGYIGFRSIDLTGFRTIEVVAAAQAANAYPGGTVEVHLDSPTGPMVGQAEVRQTGQQPAAGAAAAAGQGAAAAPAAGGAGGAAAGAAGAAGAGAAAGAAGGGGGGGQAATPGIPITLTGATGTHDVYLVFRNSGAAAALPLMSVSVVRFVR